MTSQEIETSSCGVRNRREKKDLPQQNSLRHTLSTEDQEKLMHVEQLSNAKTITQKLILWQKLVEHHAIQHRLYYFIIGAFVAFLVLELVHWTLYNQPLYSMPMLSPEIVNIMREKFSFEWTTMVRDEILSSIDFQQPGKTQGPDRPGLELSDANVTAYSPVMLIPGFTSTGLEIWKGGICSASYFRQRVWGTSHMLRQFLLNQKCWLDHMMLNRTTGLDPDGIKLRPARGLEAADYVIGGYWVWGKLIENLADIGYDSDSMFMAAYDWRLTPTLMQERDKYFTKLKFMIEMAKASNDNRKVVVIAHSYASQVVYYFLKWVESDMGGKGGPNWVDEHIEAFASIAGSFLGTVKSSSGLMSGEMKDTAELGAVSKLLAYFFSPLARTALARSWPSVYTMLPIGGETIWGNETYAPDDFLARMADGNGQEKPEPLHKIDEHIEQHGSNGAIIRFTDGLSATFTAGNIRRLLTTMDNKLSRFDSLVSGGVAADPSDVKYNHPRYWTNPLESTLPIAPNMKIFCLYGVGNPVERAYLYHRNKDEDMDANIPDEWDVASQDYTYDPESLPFRLNIKHSDVPWIKAGIRYTDGDGTVPLISLGYMCARGWREKRYNPSNSEVRIREYLHNPVSIVYDPRGGPATSDHVDIMGNYNLMRDILQIAARNYDQVPENVTSSIYELADRVPKY